MSRESEARQKRARQEDRDRRTASGGVPKSKCSQGKNPQEGIMKMMSRFFTFPPELNLLAYQNALCMIRGGRPFSVKAIPQKLSAVSKKQQPEFKSISHVFEYFFREERFSPGALKGHDISNKQSAMINKTKVDEISQEVVSQIESSLHLDPGGFNLHGAVIDLIRVLKDTGDGSPPLSCLSGVKQVIYNVCNKSLEKMEAYLVRRLPPSDFEKIIKRAMIQRITNINLFFTLFPLLVPFSGDDDCQFDLNEKLKNVAKLAFNVQDFLKEKIEEVKKKNPPGVFLRLEGLDKRMGPNDQWSNGSKEEEEGGFTLAKALGEGRSPRSP